MNNYEYAEEKLLEVIKTLAIGKADIKKRLMSAFQNDLHGLKSDQLPQNLRDKFDELKAKLTASTSYQASIGAMDDDEACSIADETVTLYSLQQTHRLSRATRQP